MKNKEQLAPTVLFIFGGSGDLNHRKLSPALFNLFIDDLMPEKFAIYGFGRTKYADKNYREYLHDGIVQFSRRKEADSSKWKEFSKNVSYISFDVDDAKSYNKIDKIVSDKTKEFGVMPNVIFYMAVAPQLVPGIAKNIAALKLCSNESYIRIVIEKPFGHDLQSAKELNALLTSYFNEEQIFRIDHYLGKETVQNILVLRFSNALFEPTWNRFYVDHVQITVSETVGVEGRGSYYDTSGALRDMVQNHILQLICMIAMETPVSFKPDEIRNKKVDVLNAIRRIKKEDVNQVAVRGQYGAGWMKGEAVDGYREEPKVAPQTSTETFTAVKFYIDNWRWQGVPFYVRTGKRMHEKASRINIQFKPAPDYAFPEEATQTWRSNRLTITIQPETDIRIRFQAKRPGPEMNLHPVDMIFNYMEEFDGKEPEAYETLLLDVMEGDPTHFMRADQVEAAWEIITPILETWQSREPMDFSNYAPGSWGPEDAEALIARDGRNWINVNGSKEKV